MDGTDLLDPGVAAAFVRETVARPQIRHVEATTRRGSVIIRITRAGAAVGEPDSRAEIEIRGSGSFRLLLDDEFELLEIDERPDSWVETVRDLVALADVFLEGRGVRQRTPAGRGRHRDGVVLELGDDSFLLEGPTRPRP